jgi:hypothetical protein
MKKQKFYQLYKSGLITIDEVDDYVEEWHTNNSITETLQEYLGMSELTDEQYSKFVMYGIL